MQAARADKATAAVMKRIVVGGVCRKQKEDSQASRVERFRDFATEPPPSRSVPGTRRPFVRFRTVLIPD